MNVFIVYAHHEVKSFNSAMFQTATKALQQAGHQVKTSELYDMKFNPVSDRGNFVQMKNPDFLKQQLEELHATGINGFSTEIRQEQEKLEWCDLLILQFPLWWFGLPAVLKGWVDKVFAMGRIYGQGKIYSDGVMKGKKALLSLTTGGTRESYLPDGVNGDMAGILRPIHRGILEFTGFSVLQPQVVYGPAHQSKAQLEAELDRWCLRLEELDKENPIVVGRY